MVHVRALEEWESAPPLADVLQALPAGLCPVLLDSTHHQGWSLLGWSPDRVLSGCLTPSSSPSKAPLSTEDPAALLEEAMAGESWTSDQEYGLMGGWVGWMGFACAHAYESVPWLPRENHDFPDYSFARYRHCLVRSPEGRTYFLCGLLPGESDSDYQDQLAQVRTWLEHDQSQSEEPPAIELRAETPPLVYQNRVEQLRTWIAEGELFQANLAHRMVGVAPSKPRAFYRKISKRQPTLRGAFWEDDKGHSLLSWSPECFLRVRGKTLETWPIKGTASRSHHPQEDAASRAALEASEKEVSELTMIVDMARNDLGRVASPGGVTVHSVGRIESFPTLFHRTAHIQAEWNPTLGFQKLMRATFPPASVTGAPKVRALQAIGELEEVDRGVYCGAFGYWLPADEPRAEFSVLIRTATVSPDSMALHVGAGIVWDSSPQQEWLETLLKASYITQS